MTLNRADVKGASWAFYACLAAVAASWALVYPFWPNRTQLLDQGKLVDYSWLAFALWAVGLAIWLGAMWNVLVHLRGRRFTEVRLLVGGTTTALYLAAIAMYPTNAIDVYIYAARSRLLTTYGLNPNAVQPVAFWDVDPYMRYASKEWADNLSPYGPLWNQLAAPVTWIGGDSIGAAVIGFKIVSALSALAIGFLVYDIVRERAPAWALPAALLWLWNPLVLWDGVGNAHNDVTLMLPVVAALCAWQRRLYGWVVPLLLASVLIKYVTLILVPVAAVAVWRRTSDSRERATLILGTAAGAILLAAISMYPFYDLGALLTSAREQGGRMAASPAWVVRSSLAEWRNIRLAPEPIIRVAYALAASVVAGWAAACWRKPERLPRAAFEVTFAFMLVASTNQRAWYVIWLVPLAAILMPENPWRRALLWSVTAMIGHALTIWLWYVWDFDAWGYYWYLLIIVSVVYVPVIILSLRELAASAEATAEDHYEPGTYTSPR